jgi:hypothetical protein
LYTDNYYREGGKRKICIIKEITNKIMHVQMEDKREAVVLTTSCANGMIKSATMNRKTVNCITYLYAQQTTQKKTGSCG